MKRYGIVLLSLVAALTLVLTACGGGGSSSRANNDRDGDGIPNAEDAFPDDAARFTDYAKSDLVVPNGVFAAALAINDASAPMIVGNADGGTGILHAVSWTVDAATGLPAAAINLNPLSGNSYSAAFRVSAAGVVVGESEQGAEIVPVFWGAGALDASALSLTMTTGEGDQQVQTVFTSGSAYGINEDGQIVGEIKRGDGTLMAVLWNGATAEPVELNSLGGSSASAYFISNGGWIVGESVTAAGANRATLWTVDTAGVPAAPLDLGVLPGHLKSIALGVDNEGRVVGESEESDGTIHAVLWTPVAGGYAITTLGAGASAQAINDVDRIAGYGGAPSQAVVWDTRNADLPGAVLEGAGFSQAHGLNQGNMVVGIAGDQGFLAQPQ